VVDRRVGSVRQQGSTESASTPRRSRAVRIRAVGRLEVVGNFPGDMASVGAGLYLVLLASLVGFLTSIAWLSRTVADKPSKTPAPGPHSEST
jgi:hypothetical protein